MSDSKAGTAVEMIRAVYALRDWASEEIEDASQAVFVQVDHVIEEHAGTEMAEAVWKEVGPVFSGLREELEERFEKLVDRIEGEHDTVIREALDIELPHEYKAELIGAFVGWARESGWSRFDDMEADAIDVFLEGQAFEREVSR